MARIPDAIKHKFRRLLELPSADKRFTQYLSSPNTKDENYKWAYELALEYGHGKPTQSIDMDLNDVTDRPTSAELDVALRSLNGDSKGNGLEKAE